MACYMIHGKVRFDTSLYSIIRDDGVEIRLSKMEVEVFSILCEYARQTVTRQFLFDNAWPNDTGSDGHLNRVILLLRRKFDSLGLFDVIKTVPKVGYIVGDADSCANLSDVIELTEEFDDVHVEAVDDQSIDASKSDVSIYPDIESTFPPNQKGKVSIRASSDVEMKDSQSIKVRYLVWVGGIGLLALLFYFMMSNTLVRGSSFNGKNETASNNFRIYNFYSNNIVSLYSTMTLNSDVQDKIGELVTTNLRGGVGHYYVSISKKAISILHMNNEHHSVSKIIYLRGYRGLLEEVGCILNMTSDGVETENFTSERIEKNSITRNFLSRVSPSCPIDHKQVMRIDLSTTVSNDAAENDDTDRNKFFYMSISGSLFDSQELFSVSTSGYVEYYMDDGVTYEKWTAKTKNINALNHQFKIDRITVKFIDNITNREKPFITRRITDGVYISDILGGVILSTR